MNTFEKLRNADISELIQYKGKFAYLSWSNAVRECTKLCPDMNWEFTSFGEFGLPYLQTPLGYFVECSVTIEGVTKKQMMPVLDHTNKTAMSPNAGMINKSQQRALAKAIALHGLGLDLWAGEDINEYDDSGNKIVVDTITEEQQAQLYELICNDDGSLNPKGVKVQAAFKFNSLAEIKTKKFEQILKAAS